MLYCEDPEWRNKFLQKLITKIDEEYQKSSSKRAKQQTSVNREASLSRRSLPENRLSEIAKNFPNFINIPTYKNLFKTLALFAQFF